MIKILKAPTSNFPKNSKFIYIVNKCVLYGFQDIYTSRPKLLLVEMTDGRINRD